MSGFLAATLAFGLAGGAQAQGAGETPLLRVTGEGRVEVAPDMAVITLGVQSREKTARAALTDNSERAAAVLDSLRRAGIAGRDMQTSGLSLGPEWENIRDGGQYRQRIIGFVASNMITVRVRDLPTLGGILDRIVDAGANNFNSLQFTSAKLREHQDAARISAVGDARRKAEIHAQAAGVTLGRLISLTETGAGGSPRPLMMRDMAMASESAPVTEGEITVSVTVEMVYSIQE